MLELLSACTRVTRLPTTGPAPWLHHQTMAALHGLLGSACEAELSGMPLQQMRDVTAVVRRFHASHSSTLAHTQMWPRGYPGDFQLIERLLDASPAGDPGTLDHALESCVLQLPIVWQHRAKVLWQAQLVRRRLADSEGIRVLSLGCGGSRDLMLLEPHELGRLAVVLADLDAAALDLSKSRLRACVRDLVCIQGNVLRSITRLRGAGPYDVIVLGGLLDYLPERAAATLMKQMVSMLAPNGLLGATNLAAGGPWRLMLELIADWRLIDRSYEEMGRLISQPGCSPRVALDTTGLTWLATASKCS